MNYGRRNVSKALPMPLQIPLLTSNLVGPHSDHSLCKTGWSASNSIAVTRCTHPKGNQTSKHVGDGEHDLGLESKPLLNVFGPSG